MQSKWVRRFVIFFPQLLEEADSTRNAIVAFASCLTLQTTGLLERIEKKIGARRIKADSRLVGLSL